MKMIELTEKNIIEIHHAYKGFHDSKYIDFVINWNSEKSLCDVNLRLVSYKIESADWVPIKLEMLNIHKFNFAFDNKYDYPNVRFDIGFHFEKNGVLIDLEWTGGAPWRKNQLNESKQYFHARKVLFGEE